MENKITRSLYIPLIFWQALDDYSKGIDRSTNWVIRNIVEKWIKTK